MHQFQILGIGTQLAKRLDHSVIQTAAAMHGDTGRLVQHDQRLVLINDGGFEALQQPLRQRLGLIALSQAQRRHAHHVTSLEFVLGLDPPLVNPHFALAQNAVNQGLGHALELCPEEVVDALAGEIRCNLDQLNAGGWRGGSSHCAIITIFYGIEALNHCCYSRERRQKRPGLRMNAKLAIPCPRKRIWT